MQHAIETFRAFVSRRSGLACTVGLPHDESLGPDTVLIWPWRLGEDSHARNLTDAGVPAPRPPIAMIHCLVFAPEFVVLERIREGAHSEPILDDRGASTRVYAEVLDSETLLRLFAAAGLVPRLCLSYALQQAPG